MPVIKCIERISLCAAKCIFTDFFSRCVTFGGIFCLFEFSLSFFRFLCVSADSSVFHQILLRLLSDMRLSDFTAFFWFLTLFFSIHIFVNSSISIALNWNDYNLKMRSIGADCEYLLNFHFHPTFSMVPVNACVESFDWCVQLINTFRLILFSQTRSRLSFNTLFRYRFTFEWVPLLIYYNDPLHRSLLAEPVDPFVLLWIDKNLIIFFVHVALKMNRHFFYYRKDKWT